MARLNLSWALRGWPKSSQWSDQLFLQAGAANDARTHVAGATWHSVWQRAWLCGQGRLYWEGSFGRCHGDATDAQATLTPMADADGRRCVDQGPVLATVALAMPCIARRRAG